MSPASADAILPSAEAPGLSIIAPARDESGTLAELVDRIAQTGARLPFAFECIIVDDASRDGSGALLAALARAHGFLRPLHLPARADGRGHGQSAALRAGILAARGALVATLDADLQNDPADLPALLAALTAQDADLVQGDRSRQRRDPLRRRLGARVGRTARRLLLGDPVRDTGCGLRLMRTEVARALPLSYRGMHRFIPVCARDLGYRVIEHPVSHAPRRAGRSHYGTFDRALPGLIDCLAVRWMRSRRAVACTDAPDGATGAAPRLRGAMVSPLPPSPGPRHRVAARRERGSNRPRSGGSRGAG